MTEETKRCAHCGRYLPLSDFYVRRSTGKYDCYCSECKIKLVQQWVVKNKARQIQYIKEYHKKMKELKEKKQDLNDSYAVGGYNIRILNYAKKGEYKYSIVSSTGETLNTNDKAEFMAFIEKI